MFPSPPLLDAEEAAAGPADTHGAGGTAPKLLALAAATACFARIGIGSISS